MWDRRALREDNPKPVGVLAGEDIIFHTLNAIIVNIHCSQHIYDICQSFTFVTCLVFDRSAICHICWFSISRPCWRDCVPWPKGWRAPSYKQQQGPDNQIVGHQVWSLNKDLFIGTKIRFENNRINIIVIMTSHKQQQRPDNQTVGHQFSAYSGSPTTMNVQSSKWVGESY